MKIYHTNRQGLPEDGSLVVQGRCCLADIGTNKQVELQGSSKRLVLVIEDEALIRICAVDIIERAGYQVLQAGDADEAIRILEGRNDIGFIFTDIDMPGSMDGLKLAHAVRDRWPPIKIIVTSGHRAPKDGYIPLGSRFLSKPYRMESVVGALSELAT